MTETALTPERILEAAEDVLRRYGPSKTTVVDVARALGVSHGSVYRHFASKAALRDAVTERWLARISAPLASVAETDGPAPDKLRQWMDLLVSSKQSRALKDPELFAAYMELVADARAVVMAHVRMLVGQLTEIIAQGIARGELAAADPAIAAKAVFDATARFHNPAHAAQWSDPENAAAYQAVMDLLLRGLQKPSREAPR